ncbi:hypothetical protein [Tepidibacter sp. Z1-5]|uniref:hypothetical protein n=1 Tax=Tepidibacter sp. Z1-5 TaxID=3134138 RepID=UPI0030BEB7C9
MYRSICIKPKFRFGFYDKFIENLALTFGLSKKKAAAKLYFLKNDDMLIKIQPRMAEIVVFDDKNIENIQNLKGFLNS